MKEGEKAKILVVDDESLNVFLLQEILSKEGYIVISGFLGSEVIDAIRDFQPDVILLDIMMPRVSGMDILKEIIKDENLKHIPVIMVTAKIESDDVKIALDAGAIDYIKKPINGVELLARVRTALRIKQQEESLKDLIKLKERFISIISHDLNNPFNAIKGFSELLISDKELNQHLSSKHKEFINFIHKEAVRAIDYFNKLLNWTSISTGAYEIEIENINLLKLVNDSVLIFNLNTKEKNIDLSINVPNNIFIKVDETLFSQAINNLLSNAVKFTPNNGKIDITANIEKEETILKISDTGIGIDEKDKLNLFSDINKNHTEGTKGEKGTGLGLSICKKIIDLHRFEIDVVSEKNKGTEFIITIK